MCMYLINYHNKLLLEWISALSLVHVNFFSFYFSRTASYPCSYSGFLRSSLDME